MRDENRHYRHLNADARWPGFRFEGLELDGEGVLRLMPLPLLSAAMPPEVSELAGRPARSGVAVDADGTVYYSDPEQHRVLCIESCTGASAALGGCRGEVSARPAWFERPAGLAISRRRNALLVADSAAGRVLLFDLRTHRAAATWAGFSRPISVAVDSEGNAYVVDSATGRVDQFSITGARVDSFWAELAAGAGLERPRLVAAEATVYVLDATGRLCEFDVAGRLLQSFDTGIVRATALAMSEGAVLVGDGDRRRITSFRRGPTGTLLRAGDAVGYAGPVAALGVDGSGVVVAAPGSGLAPLRLIVDGSRSAEGVLVSDAIGVDQLPHFWNRLHATIELEAEAHFQLFVHTGPEPPPPPDTGSADPFSAPWRPVGLDVADFFIGGRESKALWIGARFTNDRNGTPALSQLRLEFDEDGYLAHLPAIYREPSADEFLLRFVSLFESFFLELESRIDALGNLLAPDAVPAPFLQWLASFLALDLPEGWSEVAKRRAIGKAFTSYARRGTPSGLRDAIFDELGVRVVIDEPLQTAGFWAMPAPASDCRAEDGWQDGTDTILGFNTVLPSSEAQGAVVGTTAVLDRSELIDEEHYATPLFDAVAYRFQIAVHRGDVDCPETLQRLKDVVEREKPAHTAYELCFIEPALRVGYQARLGIDTVIGGGAVPGRLGQGALVLTGLPRGQLGASSQIGIGTQL